MVLIFCYPRWCFCFYCWVKLLGSIDPNFQIMKERRACCSCCWIAALMFYFHQLPVCWTKPIKRVWIISRNSRISCSDLKWSKLIERRGCLWPGYRPRFSCCTAAAFCFQSVLKPFVNPSLSPTDSEANFGVSSVRD